MDENLKYKIDCVVETKEALQKRIGHIREVLSVPLVLDINDLFKAVEKLHTETMGK